MGNDIFDFCLDFVLYFRLQAKKGLVHDERTKSLTFLQAVCESVYVDVITTLTAHIDTYLSKQDFGYLPPNLCLMGLATQMHKNVQARVRDIVPRVARQLDWHQEDWHHSSPEIQGFRSPQAFRLDTPWDRFGHGCAPPRSGNERGYSNGTHRPERDPGREYNRHPQRAGVERDRG